GGLGWRAHRRRCAGHQGWGRVAHRRADRADLGVAEPRDATGTRMDFEEIKQILALVREHELAEFELEHQDFKIRIRKEGGATVLATPPPAPAAAAPAPAPVDAAPAPAPLPLAGSGEEEVEFAVVKAPIVGTFYHAP